MELEKYCSSRTQFMVFPVCRKSGNYLPLVRKDVFIRICISVLGAGRRAPNYM